MLFQPEEVRFKTLFQLVLTKTATGKAADFVTYYKEIPILRTSRKNHPSLP